MAVSQNPAGRGSLSSPPRCPEQIRLLTLNCWGLLHISALRSPRILEIGRRIAAMDAPPDAVCFQELFCQEDFQALRRETGTILPHAKFYHSGAFGAGLAIFSRWPITSSSMNGATSNNVLNTWRWTKSEQKKLSAGDLCPVDPDTPDPRGQRLDYIFVSTGQSPDVVESSEGDGPRSGWVVESANVAMTERHPDLLVSLSDHFAVTATLTRHTSSTPRDPSAATPTTPESDYDAQLRYAASNDHHEDKTLSRSEYTSILAMIFCPRNFVAFILMLFGSVVLLAGLIDGLLALLFFSWEIRALKEFEWEVLNSQPPAPAVTDPMAVCERGQGDKNEY
ncbi:unnamed protein product [Clonostachys rosea f. rosea IK726]|uniref:Endonuclease/exonuclease/phosphatase domain-containing protein n=2 Tax=Bionectria ochroleuca TaxID=29856 RepID=A0A0B7JWS3_BIOOC|nr:unnamed protein product [Clonostachys rosea f. rosea IK726]